MNQKEAAAFLAVSDRMLRTYTDQGRVHALRDTSKPRYTLLYEVEDLNQLKAELALGKRWKTPPPAREGDGHIGFRMDAHYRQRLEEAAQKRGMSAGEYARCLIIDALEDRRSEELSSLRKAMANGVFGTLVYAGKLTDVQAEKWVRDNLEDI